jgi:transcriptional regulator with XRE-family HTH domain
MDSIIGDVGRQLGRLRRGRGWTLAELARRAGFSDGYLSSIEKGTTAPSLSALATVSAVLGSNVSAFFPSEPPENVFVHSASDPERLRFSPNRQESYTLLSSSADEPSYTAVVWEVYPSSEDIRFRYFGERFALVLSGRIEMTIGADNISLVPGECVHYSSHPEHRFRVASNTPAEVLWIVSPALI